MKVAVVLLCFLSLLFLARVTMGCAEFQKLVERTSLPSGETQSHGTRSTRAANKGIFKRIISCVSKEVMTLVRKCWQDNRQSYQEAKRNGLQKNCRRKGGEPTELLIEEPNCKYNGKRQRDGIFSDCVLRKMGAMTPDIDSSTVIDRSARQINTTAFKQYSISRSNLSESQKFNAVTTFDDCMATNYTVPYKHFGFRPSNFPVEVAPLLVSFDERKSTGELSPLVSTVTVYCMATALIQNGCSSLTQADVDEFNANRLP